MRMRMQYGSITVRPQRGVTVCGEPVWLWVQIASAREQLFEGRALERRAHLLRVLEGLALRLRHRARAEGVGRLYDLRVGVHLGLQLG